ncbi:ROK family protein [Microbacterium sp. CIAB417]|uniref:ROK family protein n=1 Tax=Microbacterium sp. CIAB417 TaxID=2860287 RepID=UPI001FABB08F|nr:ROK family protein [Microbacterium sp. CIAB417]
MKIRENEIVAAVTNMRGDIVAHSITPLLEPHPPALVSRVAEVHRAVSAERAITGIGIGVGGAVHKRRSVISASFLGWRDVPLADLVESATGAPTLVENDVVALCEYEDWFGAAREDDRFAVITLGIGTGFGLVVNGQPIVNEDYGIGLVGHWPMDPTGPFCDQGHRGCAAALLNSDAIARYATEVFGTQTSFDEAVQSAAEGHPGALRIVEHAAQGLGILIAAVCNLTLPERIIIAGEGVRLADIGWHSLLRSIRDHRSPRAHMPPIDLASGDNVEWARGAAVLAIQAFALGRFSGI